MTAVAFKGTYADFKLIKTRGVVSISFEVPVEQAQTVLDVLGGMPVAATEVWCGIARLVSAGEDPRAGTAAAPKRDMVASVNDRGQPAPDTPRQENGKPDGAKTRMAFRDMRPANQAGILCAEGSFQKFICERMKWTACTDRMVADYVRRHCNVASRSDIRPRTPSGDRWQRLVDEYRTWMHAPEMVA